MSIVREIMSTKLVSVEPSATVAEAATVMGERHVGSALVMEGGSLVGIFTERDIVRALSQDFDAPGHPISQWMTRQPTTIGADASVDQALETMLSGGFRHIPVVEERDVVGVVSMRDISKASARSE
ncbi:MAG TPA: CBS domain-containing protein [Actinomycetota bacterium]|nr:CBS domain-containing protein [Actinomycetota bacterium]